MPEVVTRNWSPLVLLGLPTRIEFALRRLGYSAIEELLGSNPDRSVVAAGPTDEEGRHPPRVYLSWRSAPSIGIGSVYHIQDALAWWRDVQKAVQRENDRV